MVRKKFQGILFFLANNKISPLPQGKWTDNAPMMRKQVGKCVHGLWDKILTYRFEGNGETPKSAFPLPSHPSPSPLPFLLSFPSSLSSLSPVLYSPFPLCHAPSPLPFTLPLPVPSLVPPLPSRSTIPLSPSPHQFPLSPFALPFTFTVSFPSLLLSRPLLRCLFGEYWFLLSRYVYDGNRSFTPILRQSLWSLLYDVYWLVTMMLYAGNRYSRYLNR